MNLEPKRFVNTNVVIGFVEGKGRALLAAQDLEADELIVSAPVLVLKGIEYYLMRIMPCINHLFAWPRSQMQGGDTAAIAFGLASLCNHSNAFANATVIRDYEQECIDLVATTKIETGKEILIKYKGPPPGKIVEDTPITMSASTRMTG